VLQVAPRAEEALVVRVVRLMVILVDLVLVTTLVVALATVAMVEPPQVLMLVMVQPVIQSLCVAQLTGLLVAVVAVVAFRDHIMVLDIVAVQMAEHIGLEVPLLLQVHVAHVAVVEVVEVAVV
jgi:hypothetical protein